jgi:O-acetyl-ADP-ribose deacetylase (regulator of RNase III)
LHGCKTGETKITRGHNLPARHVIHAVGPFWNGRGDGTREDGLLENCYRNSLVLAVNYVLKTIAFPAISTGAYRFPPHRAAEIAGESLCLVFLKIDF